MYQENSYCILIAFHDVDTGNALPIKQHPYIVHSVKLMHMSNEVESICDRACKNRPCKYKLHGVIFC